MAKLHLASTEAANEFLARDPMGLLVGMLLDQQIQMEKAFTGPYVLAERLGVDRLDPAQLAAIEPEAFADVFAEVPAIHRYPRNMAERTQKLARAVADEFDNDAASVWTGAKDGADEFQRVSSLPGYGKQKAQILVALLGKQFGVRPEGWRKAAGLYGEEGSCRSIADVTDEASLGRVREHKQAMKAEAKKAEAKKTAVKTAEKKTTGKKVGAMADSSAEKLAAAAKKTAAKTTATAKKAAASKQAAAAKETVVEGAAAAAKKTAATAKKAAGAVKKTAAKKIAGR